MRTFLTLTNIKTIVLISLLLFIGGAAILPWKPVLLFTSGATRCFIERIQMKMTKSLKRPDIVFSSSMHSAIKYSKDNLVVDSTRSNLKENRQPRRFRFLSIANGGKRYHDDDINGDDTAVASSGEPSSNDDEETSVHNSVNPYGGGMAETVTTIANSSDNDEVDQAETSNSNSNSTSKSDEAKGTTVASTVNSTKVSTSHTSDPIESVSGDNLENTTTNLVNPFDLPPEGPQPERWPMIVMVVFLAGALSMCLITFAKMCRSGRARKEDYQEIQNLVV